MIWQSLLFLHLFSVIIWVGGMFFAYFCLRPAAGQTLDLQNRLLLWVATFQRFLKLAAVAVVVIIATGLSMLLQIGFKFAPVGWHLMLSLGLLMACIFFYVFAILYPKICRQCDASSWAEAAITLNSIRKMIGLNLLISIIVIASAAFSR